MDYKEKIDAINDSTLKVLVEKNKRYGNSALEPVNYFFKGNAKNSIEIRLDDKISRIVNSKTLRKNDMFDILGYLILYCKSQNFISNKDNFKDFTQEVLDNLKLNINGLYSLNLNLKNNTIIENNFFSALNEIHKSKITHSETIITLMICIIEYFIINDITDFSEFID